MANATTKKFYVYDVISESGQVIYVGKGSGRRHVVSMKKHNGASSRIVEWFASEVKAYAAEVVRIATLKPAQNLCKGGNGCHSTQKRVAKDLWQKRFEAIGSRRYAAILALSVLESIKKNSLNIKFDGSKVDAIREVAYG